jgi:hypothetical protein
MKVKELIEYLKTLDGEMDVVINDDYCRGIADFESSFKVYMGWYKDGKVINFSDLNYKRALGPEDKPVLVP